MALYINKCPIVNDVTLQSQGRLGLTLTAAKTAIEAYGGQLSIKIELRQGSQCAIKLPIYKNIV